MTSVVPTPAVAANDDTSTLRTRLDVDEYVARVRLDNATEWLRRARMIVNRASGFRADWDAENEGILERATKARDVALAEWRTARDLLAAVTGDAL